MGSGAIFYARSCSIHSELLHEAGAGSRLELDFTKCGLILRDVLLQYVQQRFSLLWAEINTLKIVDIHVIRRGLIDHTEQQQKIPKVNANLDAIRVALAVFGCVNQLDLRLRL